MQIRKQFFRYVLQNILGMVGISLYILADTFFISLSVGADGITALNLVLPIYSLIFAIGAMIGVGAAIRFAVAKGKGEKNADAYFSNALFFATIAGIVFLVLGIFAPEGIIRLLGGDDNIVATGAAYTRIFMLFAPCFMWNSICNAFVRNDGAPFTAMLATLLSSLFNIVMDYVLMFPLGLGMAGAALATAFSPVVGVGICCAHLLSKKSSVRLRRIRPSVKKLLRSYQVGVSAFVGEISSGVTTIAFNFIILGLAGNVGVAAYGVVANTALVAVAMFNGVSQGSQPLVSEFYGKNDWKRVRSVLLMGVCTALVLAAGMIFVIWKWTTPIANIFNSEGNPELTAYAGEGLRIYFLGFLFAGINIVGTGVLSAVESARWAFAASVARGLVLILCCAFLLSALFGMRGVWMAFPAAEFLTMAITFLGLCGILKGQQETKDGGTYGSV